jgi:hypothetical protein
VAPILHFSAKLDAGKRVLTALPKTYQLVSSKEQPMAIELYPLQEQIAEVITKAIADGDNILMGPPPVGIGRTLILQAALLGAARGAFAALIACPHVMIDQWADSLRKSSPVSRVFVIRGDLFREVVAGDRPQVVTIDEMAATTPDEWKKKNPERCFFVSPFSRVEHLASRLEKWFQYAIQDESYPDMSRRMPPITEGLLKVSEKLLRVENTTEPSDLSRQLNALYGVHPRADALDMSRIKRLTLGALPKRPRT